MMTKTLRNNIYESAKRYFLADEEDKQTERNRFDNFAKDFSEGNESEYDFLIRMFEIKVSQMSIKTLEDN